MMKLKIIFDTAFMAFPRNDIITNNDYETAKEMCSEIDDYFAENKKAMNEIGNETSGNTKLWFDEQYFYIYKNDLKDVLTLQNCSINFSTKLRKTLASEEILKVSTRTNKVSQQKTTEYSLHITKPLYGEFYSKVRYHVFSIT